MGCSSPKTPATPDYAGAATAQGVANRETAITNAVANNPNVNTPYGSQQVTWGKDSDGNVVPTINQSLSPDQQTLYQQGVGIDQQLMGMASGGLSKVRDALGQTFDPSTITGLEQLYTKGTNLVGEKAADRLKYGIDKTGLPGMPEASDATRNSVTDALYRQMSSRLDPQWGQREEQNRNRLLQQGFTEGSTGFDRANENFSRDRNDAYNTALNQSIMSGGEEMQRQFNMGLAARQQGFGEAQADTQTSNSAAGQLYGMASNEVGLRNNARNQYITEALQQRQLPLNELNALRTGTQIQNPQFQGFQGSNAQAGDIARAAGQQGQWNTGVYNAQAGQAGQNASTLGQLGAAAMTASSCG